MASAHSTSPGLSAEDKSHLRRALTLAEEAVQRGNHPFGCVIVRRLTSTDGSVIDSKRVVEAGNVVHTDHDPTGHAEMNAIRLLGKYVASPDAQTGVAEGVQVSYELFTSTEPCIMCCGGIYWSFLVDRVVYACPESGLAKHAGDDFLASCRETLARGKRPIAVQGPYLQEEAEKLHAGFWHDYLKQFE
eukprot:m.235279 g.235279  ORF g.235279 m.235279 type:complete len:189 (-) comp10889_c0_seq1:113-679(-)